MAITFTPSNAMAYAKRFLGEMPLDDAAIELRILNAAANRIHVTAPWRWSLSTFPDTTMIKDTDDYAISDPGDVLYPVMGQLFYPDGKIKDIPATASLPANDSIKGEPSRWSLTSATNIRVWPTPSDYGAGKFPILVSFYKIRNTVIASGNKATATTLLFPDEWFWVYEEWVLYYGFKFSRDPQTGAARVTNQGSIETSGQLAVAQAALQEMILREKPLLMDLGEPSNG